MKSKKKSKKAIDIEILKKIIVNEMCICAISVLNLFNIVVTSDTRLRIVSVVIALVCLFYYYYDFVSTKSNKRIV